MSFDKSNYDDLSPIPVTEMLLRSIQRELECPSGNGGYFSRAIGAIIDVHHGKKPDGEFGELWNVLNSIAKK